MVVFDVSRFSTNLTWELRYVMRAHLCIPRLFISFGSNAAAELISEYRRHEPAID
jgi:hypothetical protein